MKRNSGTKSRHFHIRHWHVINLFLLLYDAIAVNAAYFFGLWLRFDFQFTEIPDVYFDAWRIFTPVNTVIAVVLLAVLHLYRSLWRFASYTEFKRVFVASLVTSAFHSIAISLFVQPMPVSYHIVGALMQFALLLAVRFSYRLVLVERSIRKRFPEAGVPRVMLIGAGCAGEMILRDIQSSDKIFEQVCCIIDDNPNNWNRYINGVPVVGGRNDILANVKKHQIKKIYVAIPSASAAERRDILDICKQTDCELLNLPGMYQFVSGNVTVNEMKKVSLEDLLGRDPIEVQSGEISDFISDKVILVTGGGGSIGSELCRQIASHHPKKLVIFDIYENNAHAIRLELEDKFPDLDLDVLIGSVRDSRRINQVFEKYRPDVVYHAAAHKHVPLMEDSPCESIKNNVIGTYKTAYSAMMYGCKRFVLISTDKAVNPTNIMGASKRICEMIIQSFDRKLRDGRAADINPLYAHSEDTFGEMAAVCETNGLPRTEFVAVRFGNVLGSNGSVIPRFKEQIAKGGPVTVTHPDIIRYFMTIPEAASLVLQAGTYANGGEIFVLDMGSPVKIDSLARNLIKLSGLTPDVDIKIEYTGLRPGEKLYEEKLMLEEGMKTTPNKLIHIGCPIAFDTDHFLDYMQKLMEASYDERDNDIRALVADVVDTYTYEKQPEKVGV
ncbi:MAG: polysaccharide biosynthesis protein [Ruminococcaceae bacterium]|nr:polysaccharide biosynthesis protein [Oscillospiraceae bacterium]